MNAENALMLSDISKKALGSLGDEPRFTHETGALLSMINLAESLLKDFNNVYLQSTGENPDEYEWTPFDETISKMWEMFSLAMAMNHTTRLRKVIIYQ